MKILKPIFFIMPLIITGCQSGKKQNLSNTIKPGRTVKKYSAISSCDSAIINNELSYDALAFELFKADTTKIKSLFLNAVVLRLEKEKNSEGGSYYLYHFTDGINKLTLYNNDGFYLEEGDIKNDKVLLNKKISIGMTKDDFLKLIKETNIKCDTISVKDDELSFETVYIFNDSKLKQIKMGQIVE